MAGPGVLGGRRSGQNEDAGPDDGPDAQGGQIHTAPRPA